MDHTNPKEGDLRLSAEGDTVSGKFATPGGPIAVFKDAVEMMYGNGKAGTFR